MARNETGGAESGGDEIAATKISVPSSEGVGSTTTTRCFVSLLQSVWSLRL